MSYNNKYGIKKLYLDEKSLMSNTYTMDEYFETRERDQKINELLSTLGGRKRITWDASDALKKLKLYKPGRDYTVAHIVDDPGREEKVIRMLFGMEPYSRSYTEKEIALELDVTKSRVIHLVDKILRKLRHPDRSASLKIFSEN